MNTGLYRELFLQKESLFFLLLSIVLHLLVGGVIYTISIERDFKSPPFLARIVSPEELSIHQGRSEMLYKQQTITRGSSSRKAQSVQPSSSGGSGFKPNFSLKEEPSFSATNEKGSAIERFLPDSIRLPEIKDYASGREAKSPLSMLFDRDIIEKQSKKEPINTAEPATSSSGITFDTKEFRYQGYLIRLKEKIESIWQYPRSAAERGIYGDLFIRFSIKKDGTLGRVDLIRTSGYHELDEAALAALKDAAPYWPLPLEWKLDEFVIDGHFIYTLYGYYIR